MRNKFYCSSVGEFKQCELIVRRGVASWRNNRTHILPTCRIYIFDNFRQQTFCRSSIVLHYCCREQCTRFGANIVRSAHIYWTDWYGSSILVHSRQPPHCASTSTIDTHPTLQDRKPPWHYYPDWIRALRVCPSIFEQMSMGDFSTPNSRTSPLMHICVWQFWLAKSQSRIDARICRDI